MADRRNFFQDILGWMRGKRNPGSAFLGSTEAPGYPRPAAHREALLTDTLATYGLRLQQGGAAAASSSGLRNARPFTDDELNLIRNTARDLGFAWYGPFRDSPITFWIDRTPGGGSYGKNGLRIGDPGKDLSVLYRIFIHEGTHASNEYRGWMYEQDWCHKPGLDWTRVGDTWTHPRQQGRPPSEGLWETLPVDTRDVSTAPGEDLAEMVRYFVHSVKNERAYLWPLDQTRPATYLWDTSPTRYVFVRDVFLRLPTDHPWYRRMTPAAETVAARNLGLVTV